MVFRMLQMTFENNKIPLRLKATVLTVMDTLKSISKPLAKRDKIIWVDINTSQKQHFIKIVDVLNGTKTIVNGVNATSIR